MGVPCDEILGNHSKGLPGSFYTLWARSGLSLVIDVRQQISFWSSHCYDSFHLLMVSAKSVKNA